MATNRIIQYMAGSKTKPPTVHLHCRVKPRASKMREGITSLADGAVEVCVAAAPVKGESNKAVLELLSRVLDVPKSDLEITRGAKSREKLVVVGGNMIRNGGEGCLGKLLKRLGDAVEGGGRGG